MYLRVTTLLACIATLTSAATIPDADPLPSLATDCIQAINNLDFTAAQELYAKVKQNSLLDASAFHLAAAMKDAFEQQLSSEDKDKLEQLITQLPISVRNAKFAEKVCMLSLERNQYLYSPSYDFIHDFNNRHAFLWRPGGIVDPGSDWILNGTITPTDYKIINIYGEYLYTADTHTYLNRRDVYTYMNEFTGIPTNIWRLKTVGDDVIIQNTWYAGGGETKDYLYAAVNLYSYDNNRGKVFGWDKDWGNDAAHIWRLEDCTTMP